MNQPMEGAPRTAGTERDTVSAAGETIVQPTEDAASQTLGQDDLIADRYRIVRPLGEGGMAAVFLAEDTESGEQVALKVPHFVGDGDSLLKRLRREGRAIAAINHPHVCGFRDIAEHRGRLLLTMDYIPGGTLSEWMQNNPEVTTDQAVSIVMKIAEGMQAAHTAGIVHRDLKAGNIMMSASGEPVITDFGMASWTDTQETVLTPTGAMIGTPGYMS
ncbi:MAG: serine/threonine-protein kinase, partial [Planctomycetota bacterium]